MINILTEHQLEFGHIVIAIIATLIISIAILYLASFLFVAVEDCIYDVYLRHRLLSLLKTLICLGVITLFCSLYVGTIKQIFFEHNTFVLYKDNVRVQNISLDVFRSQPIEKSKIDLNNHLNSLNDEEKERLIKLINDGNEYEITLHYQEKVEGTQKGNFIENKTIHQIRKK